MTRMTGPDCVVMCNLINTYIHTYILNTYNSMFVRLGTDYEIRNRGYFESIKNSANQFISKP